MDESELALKTAETALSKSRAELYSDLVKIGIPSLIAIAGIVSTYLLTKASHAKDLVIENLRDSHNTKNEINERTGELIKEITTDISKLNKTMLLYSNGLHAKITMDRDRLLFPEENKKELSNKYHDFVEMLHDIFSTEAKVMLLGRENINENFFNYQIELTRLSTNLNPFVGPDKIDELDQRLFRTRDLHKALIQSLSTVFLLDEQVD